ncbi:MAG: DUF4296 domain-containing protein [Fermentimonas sp.]
MRVKSKLVYPLLLVAVSLLITSCFRPKEVLSRKKMERLMYDVYIAEATMENDYRGFDTPEKKEAYIHRVFQQHNVTQARWDTSLSWYSDRIDLYLRMNDSVKARLKRAQEDIDALMALETLQPTFHDPSLYTESYIPPNYSFTSYGIRSGFHFRLDSTEIASKIPEDTFLLTFHVIGVPPDYPEPPTATLALTYGDTTLYHSLRLTENRGYRVDASKQFNNDTIKQISGFVHLQNPVGTLPRIQLHDIYLGNLRPGHDLAPADSLAVDSITTDLLAADSLAVDSLKTDLEPIDSIAVGIALADTVVATPLKPDAIHPEVIQPDTVL